MSEEHSEMNEEENTTRNDFLKRSNSHSFLNSEDWYLLKWISDVHSRMKKRKKTTAKRLLIMKHRHPIFLNVRECRVSVRKMTIDDIQKFNCTDRQISGSSDSSPNNSSDSVAQNQKIDKSAFKQFELHSNLEKPPPFIFHGLIRRLNAGEKIDKINFQKYMEFNVHVDKMSDDELKRTKGLHRLLERTVYDAVFERPSICKSSLLKEVIEIVSRGIPLDGSQTSEVINLVTILRACSLKAKNGLKYRVKYPKLPAGYKDQGKKINFSIEIPHSDGTSISSPDDLYPPELYLEEVDVPSPLHVADRYHNECHGCFGTDGKVKSYCCLRELKEGYQCIYCKKLFNTIHFCKQNVEIHEMSEDESD